MATATVNVVAYLGANFSSTIIDAIKNGTRTDTAVYLADSNRADGRPTVQLVDEGTTAPATKAVFGFIERDISGDALNPSSVDSNGNVTYNNIGTVRRSGVIRVTKKNAAGVAQASVAADIGMGVEGVATEGGANVGAVTPVAAGYGEIIARSGNDLFVLLD